VPLNEQNVRVLFYFPSRPCTCSSNEAAIDVLFQVSYTLSNLVSYDVRTEIMDQVECLQPDILVLGSRGLGTVRGYGGTTLLGEP
jgi:hypothetical protein